MLKIEYEIDLNENGRPCIKFVNEYEDKPEDKFLAIELARYILQDVLRRRSAEFDKDAAEKIEMCANLLGQIGDEIAALLWENMKVLGDTAFMINNNFHFRVNSIEERDKIGKYIITDNKVFERKEGLKVLVIDENKTYQLIGGVENDNWQEVRKDESQTNP